MRNNVCDSNKTITLFQFNDVRLSHKNDVQPSPDSLSMLSTAVRQIKKKCADMKFKWFIV